MTTSVRLSLVAALVAVLPWTAAHAQTLDHLKCHKMKDPLKLKEMADLIAESQPQFSATDCTISKPKMFCVPVTKTNVDPPAPLTVNGAQLATDFICYSVKCPIVALPNTDVSDQFGSRTQTGYRTTMVCAPAIKGTVATTTTTTPSGGGTTTTTTLLGGAPLCGQAGNPECNGTCSTPGSICADIGSGHCGCIAGGGQPCGVIQGAPSCAGACTSPTPWCKNLAGTCTCSALP